MTEYAPKPDDRQPYEYRRGRQYVAYEKDGKQLIVTHGLGDLMRNNRHPIATYGGPNTAEMDGAAFEILWQACGGSAADFDKVRFERYLDAIIEFETKYSDNEERHQHRLPIEQDILDILKAGGYFDR